MWARSNTPYILPAQSTRLLGSMFQHMERSRFVMSCCWKCFTRFLYRTGLFLFLTLCVHKEGGSQPQVSFLKRCPPWFWGALSLTGLWSSLCSLDQLASEPQWSSCPRCWDYKLVSHAWRFTWVLGVKLRSSCLCSKHLTNSTVSSACL